ncbi:MAPEG family protein [Tianweitania sp. BSSL-BM11]|uniref:MAPEG family protein n=1 Tax=Tianweitania aestuarii TaxID=2814886 RepID=A0ABS5RV25_9HYPH|nr:MAPEG family protein [Tianweitania aestuarii]MBS9720918.1 MAPEG family protein [Tianweitania aestuarii]
MDGTSFEQEQRGVALGMAVAALVTGVALAAAVILSPDTITPLPDRLKLVLTCDLFVVLWLALAIGTVARLRFFSVQDIAGSAFTEQSQQIRVASAFLQNTLEQVTLAVPVHLALACLVGDYDYIFPTLAALFCLGRLLFWIGYKRGARARAFGFALTFYPNLGMLFLAVALAIISVL